MEQGVSHADNRSTRLCSGKSYRKLFLGRDQDIQGAREACRQTGKGQQREARDKGQTCCQARRQEGPPQSRLMSFWPVPRP